MKTDKVTDYVPVLSTLFEKTAHWFVRAKASLLDELPCGKGCSHCCVGVFPVTVLDRREIQRGLRTLSPEKRRVIMERAVAQTRLMERDVPELAHDEYIDNWQDSDTDVMIERYRELPCPALQSDGTCGIYAFRPLTCRSMGIPSEVDGVVQGACAVQTSVPIIRLSLSLRQEEDRLVDEEADQLVCLRDQTGIKGEELFLPYAFVPEIDKKSTRGAP
ncbi:MAG: YkgJ family cysteine cluster protein [Nitrospira sp.]|nr:YkgJ family cysteine cluster protein [Nitrospira sp.]